MMDVAVTSVWVGWWKQTGAEMAGMVDWFRKRLVVLLQVGDRSP